MGEFATKLPPVTKDDIAPDGSDVRVVLSLAGRQASPGPFSHAVLNRNGASHGIDDTGELGEQ